MKHEPLMAAELRRALVRAQLASPSLRAREWRLLALLCAAWDPQNERDEHEREGFIKTRPERPWVTYLSARGRTAAERARIESVERLAAAGVVRVKREAAVLGCSGEALRIELPEVHRA